ncbi:MAG: RDD family protein [Cytophagaceae bacterium]
MEPNILDAQDSTSTDVQRVGFGIRLGASLLDIVTIIAITFALAPLLSGVSNEYISAIFSQNPEFVHLDGWMGALMRAVLLIPIIDMVYHLVEGLTGLTLGKLIVGIKVGSKEGTQSEVGNLFLRYLLKSSGTILSLLNLYIGIQLLGSLGGLANFAIFVGCFFVLGDKRQAFHDMLSKTAVYKRSMLK